MRRHPLPATGAGMTRADYLAGRAQLPPLEKTQAKLEEIRTDLLEGGLPVEDFTLEELREFAFTAQFTEACDCSLSKLYPHVRRLDLAQVKANTHERIAEIRERRGK